MSAICPVRRVINFVVILHARFQLPKYKAEL